MIDTTPEMTDEQSTSLLEQASEPQAAIDRKSLLVVVRGLENLNEELMREIKYRKERSAALQQTVDAQEKQKAKLELK